MIQLYAGARLADNPDRVEPIAVLGAPVARDPGAGHGGDLPALVRGDRVQRVTECPTGAGLHLDEGDGVATPGDQVDFLVAAPEVAIEDGPAVALEGPGRQALGDATEFM